MSLIKKTQRSSLLSLRPCNTSEMTLGRVLWIDLGILFDYEDHGREDRQSFESATLKRLSEEQKVDGILCDDRSSHDSRIETIQSRDMNLNSYTFDVELHNEVVQQTLM